MTWELMLRLTGVLLGWAILQQSFEHLLGPKNERLLFGARGILALLLLAGYAVVWVIPMLIVTGLVALKMFQGPYNGGSDKMQTLVLWCLGAGHLLPPLWSEVAMGYLAVQLVLSYFISGIVKLRRAPWRNGNALRDVFEFSTYPVSRRSRQLANYPQLLSVASWLVIGFETLFPLALLHPLTLYAALALGLAFHFANALLFGLNRFFWAWLAAYPALIWWQDRIISPFLTI